MVVSAMPSQSQTLRAAARRHQAPVPEPAIVDHVHPQRVGQSSGVGTNPSLTVPMKKEDKDDMYSLKYWI
jgi:hypothetical protein